MREIKFRAWDKVNKFLTQVMTLSFRDGKVSTTHYSNGGGVYLHDDEVVLMQYTGLKDKNGKEIYEGDIIKFDKKSPEIKSVFYKNGSFCILDVNDVDICYLGDCIFKDEYEIIGDIYQNPELLKQ